MQRKTNLHIEWNHMSDLQHMALDWNEKSFYLHHIVHLFFFRYLLIVQQSLLLLLIYAEIGLMSHICIVFSSRL